MEIKNSKKKVYDSNFNNDKKKDNIICDVSFENGFSLYKLFESVKYINDKINFLITSKKVEAYTFNELKTILIVISFVPNKYNFYSNHSQKLTFNLKKLISLLKCRNKDNLQTFLRFKNDGLNIQSVSKDNYSKIERTLKNLEENIDDTNFKEDLINISYQNFFEITENYFNYLISQLGRLSEVIKLKISENFIEFIEENSFGRGNIKRKRNLFHKSCLTSKEVEVYFSIQYLEIIKHFLFESNQKVIFFLSKSFPIKLSLELKTLNKSKILFFIAQREVF
ncbi:MAG: hypothetical protein ACTSPQ_12845 [Candidatus Helarchaeota archaeon]